MVTVAETADRFMEVLFDRAKQFRPSPPTKPMLRQIFLDWCTQIPIVQVREYILADFSQHLEAIYLITQQKEEEKPKPTFTQSTKFTKLEQFIKPTLETAPYMSFSPQPSTYIEFLQDLLGYLTPNEPNGELFWEVLNAVLSPSPVTFSAQDGLILQEVRFNVLFELLVRYLPTLKLGSSAIINRLQAYPQVLVQQILNYFTSLPYNTNHTHTSTLAKAITSVCLIIQPSVGEAQGNSNILTMMWLESMFSSFKQLNGYFDLSYLFVDILTLWSHFLLIPSLFSQSINWSMKNEYQGNLQDRKYTLLSESDYNMMQDVTLFSPVILSRLIPYMNHLVQMLSPQSTSYPSLFTVPRLISGMMFVFSMFQHIGTIVRFYNTQEFQQFTDLNLFKNQLILLAKTLQTITVACEGLMLPTDLQRTAISVIELVQKMDRNREMRKYRRAKRTAKLNQAKIKKEEEGKKKNKQQQIDDDTSDSDAEVYKKEKRESGMLSPPLLQLAAIPVIATIKDFLSNNVLKSLLYTTTTIPFTRGQELNVMYLHKAQGAVYSMDDFSATLLSFVGGKAKDLRAQKKRDALAHKRKVLELQKKQKHLLHQTMHLKKKIIIDPQAQLTEEEKARLNDDIINDPNLTDQQRIVLIAKRMEEQDAIEKAIQRKANMKKKNKKQLLELRKELAATKSTPLTSLLNQLVVESKANKDSDFEDDDDNQGGEEEGDEQGQDGRGISFEDEAYGAITDTLLGSFKSRMKEDKKMNRITNGEDGSDGDDDSDDDDDDSDQDTTTSLNNLIQDELFSFKANTADFDDFGDINIE